jgi:mevalonate pyrophosphate decarboxylase
VNSSCKKLDPSLEDDMEYMEMIISNKDDNMSKRCWHEATKVTEILMKNRIDQ